MLSIDLNLRREDIEAVILLDISFVRRCRHLYMLRIKPSRRAAPLGLSPPASMSSPYTLQELQAALATQVNAERTSHWLVAGMAIFVYDYCLTFREEVAYVWSSKASTVKTLFLLNRYCMPVFMILVAPGNGFLQLPLHTCQVMLVIISIGVPLMFAIWNWLVGVRVVALYRDSPQLKRFIQIAWLLTATGNVTLSTWQSVRVAKHAVVIWDIKLCGPGWIPRTYFLIWIPSICFETIVFTLAMRKLIILAKTEQTPLLQLLLRDGFLHFIGLTGTRTANLILYINGDLHNIYMVFFFFLGFGSTIISRMVLNLRGVNREAIHRSFVHYPGRPSLSKNPSRPIPPNPLDFQDTQRSLPSPSPGKVTPEVFSKYTAPQQVHFGDIPLERNDSSRTSDEHFEMFDIGRSGSGKGRQIGEP